MTPIARPRNWIAVASAEHVRRGVAGGFMQVNHGKAAPLRRIRPGDCIVYYSPGEVRGVKDGLQSFTALGVVRDGEPYQGDMGGGFTPFRRDVDWRNTHDVPIRGLLDRLALTAGRPNWGQVFRYGLVEIGESDAAVIAAAMAT